MNYTHFVGIDVSKNTLDFAVLNGSSLCFQSKEENGARGISAFVKQLKSLPGFCFKQTIFCMEHTGIYNQHLLGFLYRRKASVCLESSVHIKQSSGLQRGKNDAVDALRIAQYAYKNREELRLWEPHRSVIQNLKHLIALRSRLITVKKQLTTPLKESALFLDKSLVNQMVSFCKNSMAAVQKDLQRVEKQIQQLIASDEQLSKLFSLITSVNGIGKVTASAMLVTTNEFKDIQEPARFACYAGVAPFEHSSGSSVRGKTRVSHKANKAMKSLLHLSAISAIRHNSDMKAYYQRKLAENKNKMSIINAVRNKLVWRVFACVRNNRLYQEKYVQACC
jgi:transposase